MKELRNFEDSIQFMTNIELWPPAVSLPLQLQSDSSLLFQSNSFPRLYFYNMPNVSCKVEKYSLSGIMTFLETLKIISHKRQHSFCNMI